jgi:hypothetical protein
MILAAKMMAAIAEHVICSLGMLAGNMERQATNSSMAYSDMLFFSEAQEMARKMDTLLREAGVTP